MEGGTSSETDASTVNDNSDFSYSSSASISAASPPWNSGSASKSRTTRPTNVAPGSILLRGTSIVTHGQLVWNFAMSMGALSALTMENCPSLRVPRRTKPNSMRPSCEPTATVIDRGLLWTVGSECNGDDSVELQLAAVRIMAGTARLPRRRAENADLHLPQATCLVPMRQSDAGNLPC